MSNYIKILDPVNQKEMATYLKSSNLYVTTSFSDGSSVSLLEAMACGTPVVTYNTGGSPECLDKKSGIIVNKGDVEGLLSAINTIVNSKTTYSKEICASRAKLLFESRGFNIVPFKVDFNTPPNIKSDFIDFIPSSSGLRMTEIAFREVLGRLYYNILL